MKRSEGGRYKMNWRGICLDSSSAFIRVMRAAMSLSELTVCRLLTLDLRLRRRLSEGRDKVTFEDFEDLEAADDEDDDDEELEDDLPRAPLAHLVIACSTTEARTPRRPPARSEPQDDDDEEEDDDEEDLALIGVDGRAEGGRSPR